MERHRCKLCFRNFANGRALGGHMRSHMMKLYAAEKEAAAAAAEHDQSNDIQESDDFDDQYSSSTSSASDDDDELEVMVQDGESETESIPGRRRSKRVRKSGQLAAEHEPLSSISDTTPEEHVAHCLMMLSRDKWSRDDGDDHDHGGDDDNEKVVDFVEDDYSEDSKVAIKSSRTSGGGGTSSKVRGKYRCETCNKSFRSYQALGGHRASHKKIRVNEPRPGGSASEAIPLAVEEKVHECPFCHRVFSSGQALGGHKRSHFINGVAVNVVKKSSRIIGEGLNIDLNLPAPVDNEGDYCDDEISQVAVSAVSDEEFVQHR